MNPARLFATAFLFFITVLHAQTDVRHGLVSYWPLDADAGGFSADLGYGNNTNIVGTPSFVPAVTGNGVQINAATDYLNVVHSSSNTVMLSSCAHSI